ncbi:MAG: YHS domain-containing protein [Acidobacteriota bacterium]
MRILLQILAFLFLLYLVRYILKTLFSGPRPEARFRQSPFTSARPGRRIKQGKMEKDPICGMYVDVEHALQASFKGEPHYFCSSECLQKFKETH